jgi:hypothetical protein
MKNHSCSFLSRLALPGLMSVILLAPAIARADVFELMGTAFNGSGVTLGSCAAGATCPFKGALTIDTATGTAESADLTLPGLPSFDDLTVSRVNGIGTGWEIGAKNSSGETLTLDFTTPGHSPPSLLNFTGGSIFGGGDSSENYAITGGTVAPAPVPEPTSLALLAGVIGWVLFDLNCRFRKKSAIH